MSAANASSPSASRQEEVRAQEPSMEEILASIRRIIADDEAPAARRDERRRAADQEPVVASAQEAYAAPVLERREPTPLSIPEPRAEAAPIAEIRPLRLAVRDAEPERVVDESDEAENNVPDAAMEYASDDEDVESAQQPSAPLISPDAASSIASHFETLAATMMINDSDILRDYAQEMMRPLLKQWLDDNLPVIVERLVRAEIERVARGGRR